MGDTFFAHARTRVRRTRAFRRVARRTGLISGFIFVLAASSMSSGNSFDSNSQYMLVLWAIEMPCLVFNGFFLWVYVPVLRCDLSGR